MSKKRFIVIVLLVFLLLSIIVNAQSQEFFLDKDNNLVTTKLEKGEITGSQAGKYGIVYETNNFKVTRSSFNEITTVEGLGNFPFQISIDPELLKKAGALKSFGISINDKGQRFLNINPKDSGKEPLKIQITPNQIITLNGKKGLELKIRNRFVEDGKLQGESELLFNQEALDKIDAVSFGKEGETDYLNLELKSFASVTEIEIEGTKGTGVLSEFKYPLFKTMDIEINPVGGRIMASYSSNTEQSRDVIAEDKRVKSKKDRVVFKEKVLLKENMIDILTRINTLNFGFVPEHYIKNENIFKNLDDYSETLDFMISGGGSVVIGTGLGDLNQNLQKDLNRFLGQNTKGSFAFHKNIDKNKLMLQIDNIENTKFKRHLFGKNVGKTVKVYISPLTSEEVLGMINKPLKKIGNNVQELEIESVEVGSLETQELETREIIGPQPSQPKKDFGEFIAQDILKKVKAWTSSEKAKNQAEEDKRRNIGLIAINQYFDRVTEGAYDFDFENNRFTIPVVDLGQRNVKEVLKSKNIQIGEGEELRVTHIYNTQKWGLEIKKKDGTKQEINIPEEKINEYSDLRFGMK